MHIYISLLQLMKDTIKICFVKSLRNIHKRQIHCIAVLIKKIHYLSNGTERIYTSDTF